MNLFKFFKNVFKRKKYQPQPEMMEFYLKVKKVFEQYPDERQKLGLKVAELHGIYILCFEEMSYRLFKERFAYLTSRKILKRVERGTYALTKTNSIKYKSNQSLTNPFVADKYVEVPLKSREGI